jgi:hypothetical protein
VKVGNVGSADAGSDTMLEQIKKQRELDELEFKNGMAPV